MAFSTLFGAGVWEAFDDTALHVNFHTNWVPYWQTGISSRSIYISNSPTGIRTVVPSGSVKISSDSSSSAIRIPWERIRRRSRKTSTFAVRRFQVWRNIRHHVISCRRRCPTQHPCQRSVTSRTAHKFMFVYGFSGIFPSCRSLVPNSCLMEAKLFNVNTKLDEKILFKWKIKINHGNLVKIL